MSEVEIKWVVRYRGAEPGPTYRIDGTVLTADTNCGEQCSVSYDVTAPQGVAIRGENGSGDLSLTDVAEVDVTVGSGSVTVNGATGSVRAQTGSGDINVTDIAGAVTLHAGSGSIEGRDLAGGDVTVEVDSGDILLSLAAPRSVWARAGSGDIAVSVPDGGYRVSVRTGSGDQAVDVIDDLTARNVLDLSSGSGDIAVSRVL